MAQGRQTPVIVGAEKHRYEYIPNWGKFPERLYNNSIAVDSQDRVFVCTLGIGTTHDLKPAPLMVIADSTGEVVDSWGTGACVHAAGLNIVDDTVYVCDKRASVCLKYTLDGKILRMLGHHGVHSDTGCTSIGGVVPRAVGPFNRPDDFTGSPWGDMYAADGTHNARIHRFDSGGHLIQSWGSYGSEPGQFKNPHAVLATADGKLYVCDRLNHRVQIFSREGRLLDIWAGELQWPSEIVVTPEGEFAICEDPGNPTVRGVLTGDHEEDAVRPSGVRILDRAGKLTAHLDVGPAHQLAIDSRGDIYTATHSSVNKLVRLS